MVLRELLWDTRIKCSALSVTYPEPVGFVGGGIDKDKSRVCPFWGL
jgi:hypothetical protein